jgi:hypothetical protein
MNASTWSGRLLAVSLAAVAVLVAGCSTSSPSAGPTSTPTVRASSPSGRATTTPAATPAASTGPAPCTSKVLSVVLAQGNSGSTGKFDIRFQNFSGTACTLYGFPSVAFANKSLSAQVGSAATRNMASPERLVTVSPEGNATALISVANASGYPGACDQTAVGGLIVQAPGMTTPVHLPFSGVTCADASYHVLTVNALVAGPMPYAD